MMMGRFADKYNCWDGGTFKPDIIFTDLPGFRKYIKSKGVFVYDGCYPCIFSTKHHAHNGFCQTTAGHHCEDEQKRAWRIFRENGGQIEYD